MFLFVIPDSLGQRGRKGLGPPGPRMERLLSGVQKKPRDFDP